MVNLYLIFEQNRVFYVTISDRKHRDQKTWVRFVEDGIAEERKLHKEVILAIEDTEEMTEDNELFLGRDVVYEDTLIGCVVDVFYNGAQDVLVISTSGDTELLIPMVEHYLLPEEAGSDVLHTQNLDQLLAASGLKIESSTLMEIDA